MSKGKSTSWAEQLADLDDPTPRELDPEDALERIEGTFEIEADHTAAARAHYIDVGKSKLRKRNETRQDLGAQYAGSSIGRDVLIDDEVEEDDPFGHQPEDPLSNNEHYAKSDEDLVPGIIDEDEEIESDEAFESGDDILFQDYKFMGSRAPEHNEEAKSGDDSFEVPDRHGDMASGDEFEGVGSDADQNDGADEMSDNMEEVISGGDSESDSDSNKSDLSDQPNQKSEDDRAALRKMMGEDRKIVAASLSQAAKADIEKGRAVKRQRITFDSLLNTRIKLQKALIATNSLDTNPTTPSPHISPILAAESAALTLWNNLSTLRSSLHPPQKRPFSATSTTPSPDLWSHMQTHETTSLPARRANLTKWSHKTNPTASLPPTNKFSQTPAQKPLTSVLDHHLSGLNYENLIAKTRTPRNCAPVQAAASTTPTATADPTIYDDTDFYTLLLRELVDQRMSDSSSTTNINTAMQHLPSQREMKIKRQVDTKASKGRKMRYTVHEKLQNFMAPEDRGTWGERQRGELFGGLLGRRVVGLGEEDDGDGAESEEEGEEGGGEGKLRLFG